MDATTGSYFRLLMIIKEKSWNQVFSRYLSIFKMWITFCLCMSYGTSGFEIFFHLKMTYTSSKYM
jgi:hypothetical protein